MTSLSWSPQDVLSWNGALLVGSSLIIGGIAYTVVRKASLGSTSKKLKCALNPEDYTRCKLVNVTSVSHNSSIYRFKLPKQVPLNLPIGRHISVRATVGTRVAIRSYTPISDPDSLGYFELLVKTYPNGTVSKYLSELKIGDMVEVKGPKGSFEYDPKNTKQLGMIAGGTGITPMYQVIKHALSLPDDKTYFSLVYANVNEDDILLRLELDQLASSHPDRFKVYYTLDNPPSRWKEGSGFVTSEMITNHLPRPAKDAKILICGPPPMVASMFKHCESIGYSTDMLFKF